LESVLAEGPGITTGQQTYRGNTYYEAPLVRILTMFVKEGKIIPITIKRWIVSPGADRSHKGF